MISAAMDKNLAFCNWLCAGPNCFSVRLSPYVSLRHSITGVISVVTAEVISTHHISVQTIVHMAVLNTLQITVNKSVHYTLHITVHMKIHITVNTKLHITAYRIPCSVLLTYSEYPS